MATTPIKPVAQWQSYEDAEAAVRADLPHDYALCRRLIEEHDAWLDGDGWLGHRTGDRVVDTAMRDRIKPQFVADDVVGELVENRTNGLIGQEADVQLQPLEEPPEDEKLAAAIEQAGEDGLAALAIWWDRER